MTRHALKQMHQLPGIELQHILHDVILGDLIAPSFHCGPILIMISRHRQSRDVGRAVEQGLVKVSKWIIVLCRLGCRDKGKWIVWESLLVAAQNSTIAGTDLRM